MDERYRLVGCRGCGSAIVAMGFEVAGLAYDYEELDLEQSSDRDRLRALNPLGQVPVVVMPDGRIMTESAAIILLLGDLAPRAGLVPPPGSPERAAFLRFLIFMVAAIYPDSTFGDVPERWLPGQSAAAPVLRASTDRHTERLWRQVESELSPAPWFLGQVFSALDLYVAVMTHWRPARAWFELNCPKLFGIATATDRLPAVRPIVEREFG